LNFNYFNVQLEAFQSLMDFKGWISHEKCIHHLTHIFPQLQPHLLWVLISMEFGFCNIIWPMYLFWTLCFSYTRSYRGNWHKSHNFIKKVGHEIGVEVIYLWWYQNSFIFFIIRVGTVFHLDVLFTPLKVG
jgi:hypothetical protein